MHDLDRTQVGIAGEEFFGPGQGGPVFNEEEQMDLAAQMMEVNSEEEFEDFLGDLISKGAQALGSFIGSPTGNALGNVLKGAAKQLLPMAGLGFEAEMEAEEQEWEAANAFVKMAGEAVKNAATAPHTANPVAVAKDAVVEAAKVHAPAIVPALTNGGAHTNGHAHTNGAPPYGFEPPQEHGGSGRWVRHGRRIILHGV